MSWTVRHWDLAIMVTTSTAASISVLPTSLDATPLREAIVAHRLALLRRLESGEDGLSLGRANARFLTGCFQLLFDGAARHVGLPRGIGLAAVGSLGRGAVALQSDADVVLVVAPRVSSKEAGAIAERLLYPLWDAGLAIGHQVLSGADALSLAREDLATATALLDMRMLAGDAALVDSVGARAAVRLFDEAHLGDLIDRLESEAASRHERFGGTPYLLEPDVKCAPGGLRDLDGLRWLARARYRVSETEGAGTYGIWGELLRLAVLVRAEAEGLACAEDFLWRVRNRLHARASRKSDRLSFEDQEALAEAMGYGPDRGLGAQALMQAFYLNARTVTQARTTLFGRLRPQRRRGKPSRPRELGQGLQLFEGQVTIVDRARMREEPALAMRAFTECVRNGVPMLPFAREAIGRCTYDVEWCERLRASPEASGLFVELVCMPETRTKQASTIRELHDVGLLQAMIPEFLPVIGRVHHDVYHVFTVDAHLVAAVERLRQLARGELAQELPLASRLAAEVSRPQALYLATLLHDIGKGWPDATGSHKNHSQVGAEQCGMILRRLGTAPEDVEEVTQLVRDHLVMYEIATRRDLQDPGTADEFAARVQSRERLRNLYLLTVVDVGTTSPGALTSWKVRMLDELYFATELRLAGQRDQGLEAERIRARLAVVRAEWSGPSALIDSLLAGLPDRYLRASSPESIVQHARVVLERGARAAHVARVPSRYPAAAELCIVADDRPGLLSGIAAVITANRLEVLTAEVYSHPAGAEREALDIFWVHDHEGGTAGVDLTLRRLARDLEEVCSGRIAPADLLRARVGTTSPWRNRASPAVATEILFDDRASPTHTIVEVYARDRPGLLYALAETIHELGLSILLSKINTEGTRAADVFYVSESSGAKLTSSARQAEVQKALERAIQLYG